MQHVSFKAGGNDDAQLKVAATGVVTTGEEYTLSHSAHVGSRFLAVTWHDLPSAPESEHEETKGPDRHQATS